MLVVSKAKYNEFVNLTIVVCALVGPALGFWMLRDKPLTARTPQRLAQMARDHYRNQVVDELEMHVDARDTRPEEILKRWQQLQQEMKKAGARNAEIVGVINAAYPFLTGHYWPAYARRASVGRLPVWIIEAAWPLSGGVSEMRLRKFKEQKEARLAQYSSDYRIVVVTAKAPYNVIATLAPAVIPTATQAPVAQVTTAGAAQQQAPPPATAGQGNAQYPAGGGS
jgi:hypothetical protein